MHIHFFEKINKLKKHMQQKYLCIINIFVYLFLCSYSERIIINNMGRYGIFFRKFPNRFVLGCIIYHQLLYEPNLSAHFEW